MSRARVGLWRAHSSPAPVSPVAGAAGLRLARNLQSVVEQVVAHREPRIAEHDEVRLNTADQVGPFGLDEYANHADDAIDQLRGNGTSLLLVDDEHVRVGLQRERDGLGFAEVEVRAQ